MTKKTVQPLRTVDTQDGGGTPTRSDAGGGTRGRRLAPRVLFVIVVLGLLLPSPSHGRGLLNLVLFGSGAPSSAAVPGPKKLLAFGTERAESAAAALGGLKAQRRAAASPAAGGADQAGAASGGGGGGGPEPLPPPNVPLTAAEAAAAAGVTVHDAPDGPALRPATPGELASWRRYAGGKSPYFCRKRCCWRWEPAAWPYAGRGPANVTRSDIVSMATNKYLGDVLHSTKLPRPPGWSFDHAYHPDLADCLQPSTVIFVDTPDLPRFFEDVWPRIRHPFVLVSGDSDDSAPKRFRERLDDPKLLHWMAMNCDMSAAAHPKLSCLPLGASPWGDKLTGVMAALQAGDGLREGVRPSRFHPKATSKLLLVAFTVRPDREAAYNASCTPGGALRAISTCPLDLSPTGKLDIHATLAATARHAFVIAPPGLGIDTFRLWETLYMGSYPIVLRGEIDSELADLPVVIVDSYAELTRPALERLYATMAARDDWDYGRLYTGWYHRYLGRFREGYDKKYRLRYARRAAAPSLR